MTSNKQYSLEDLQYLMARLRDPKDGCPWDLQQNYVSITPSTIEEAYEVVDAIEQEDFDHLQEELGDFLFQVIFYCQLAKEEARFDVDDVVHGVTAKLIRRHPHVFPTGELHSRVSEANKTDDTAVKASWEGIKQNEREAKGKMSVLDDVPKNLPGLTRAYKLQKRAARLDFDWKDKASVLAKVREELDELTEAMQRSNSQDAAEELGDLMFTCVNLSRHLGEDPEALMRQANKKFERRVKSVEAQLNRSPQKSFTPHELDRFWQIAKGEEHT